MSPSNCPTNRDHLKPKHNYILSSLNWRLKLLSPVFFLFSPCIAQAVGTLEEIIVIAIAPGSAVGSPAKRLPFAIKSANFTDLQNQQALDLSDFLNSTMGSVSINSAQNNPLQPDLHFRGFTASPLLGLPQGIAVYQNGVRINEPLGDAVNWDLLPESAVYRMDLISSANPVFGPNALGGALAIKMKNGFNFMDSQIEVQSGSWGRTTATFESGNNFTLGDGSSLAYYLNGSTFNEDGWRDLSKSKAQNFYGSLGWRSSAGSTVNLNYQQADSELIGNGALPIGMLPLDRSAVFTAPDITENDLYSVSLEAILLPTETLTLSGNLFWRENTTHSFNGDASEFELCKFSGGRQALFEEADDLETELEVELGIVLDDFCNGEDADVADFDDLQELIRNAAIAAGLDPGDFNLEDASDEIYGSGILADEAINNISQREQTSRGFTLQGALLASIFGNDNQLVFGVSYFDGEAEFRSVTELAFMNPVTRSSAGLGTGSFLEEGETDVSTSTKTLSIFFVNALDVSDRLTLTVAGRYNDIDIKLRDLSRERPELNGNHNFSRFNPSVGLTYDVNEQTNFYLSYSESNRAPTPIELACNEGVFELARQFAIDDGEDPGEVDFECRLPNAFLADPPLEDVAVMSFEGGMRGRHGNIAFQLSFFNAINHDDILFQTTGRATGLFANIDKTRRRGVETAVQGKLERLSWYANWTYLQATFEDNFTVLSPNHPYASDEGELAVQSGDRLPGLPEHVIKLGVDFQVSDNFSIGAELIYNSDQVVRGDESNQLPEVDGFSVLNLRVSYAIHEQFSIYARVTNVLDTDFENFGLLGEDPSEILALTDDRPLFLGVAAPRGAWLGMRYRF